MKRHRLHRRRRQRRQPRRIVLARRRHDDDGHRQDHRQHDAAEHERLPIARHPLPQGLDAHRRRALDGNVRRHRLRMLRCRMATLRRIGERAREVVGRLPALVRLLGERAQDHRLELIRDRRAQAPRRRRRRVQMIFDDLDRIFAHERPPPGDELEEHDAERVQVAARVGGQAARLLRAEIAGRAEHRARLRQLLMIAVVGHFGEPEVEQLDDEAGAAAVDEHDVRRLDVAMDDAEPVRVLERRGHAARDHRPLRAPSSSASAAPPASVRAPAP